jgi:hypothetical protein
MKPKPPPETIIQQVVRKTWYPHKVTKGKPEGKPEVNEVVDNLIKVLKVKEVSTDFEEVCSDIVRINK